MHIMQPLLGGLETGMLPLDRFVGSLFLCCRGITMSGLKGSGDVVDCLPAKEVVFHHKSMLCMACIIRSVD